MLKSDHSNRGDRFFLAIANSSGDVLHFNSAECPIHNASPDTEVLLGYSRGELSGHPAMNIIHPADRETVLNTMALAVEGQLLSSQKIRLIKNDGTLLDAIMCPFSLKIDGKDRGGAILRDVSMESPNEIRAENGRTASDIIPICMYCSKIRNQAGAWQTPVAYLQSLTGADLSHGICPECVPGLRKQ